MGLLIIANIIECFSYGFGITITSKISKLMVLQDFRRAKLTTVIVLLQVLLISVVISLMIFVFRENIARLFIANGDSQLILVEILRLYCLILPFQLLRGALQSVNRSIGNGTIMFMVDLWANYILHAIAIYLFYRYSYSFDIVDLKIIKSTCICWAVFVSFVASCLGGFLVMIFTNWKRESSRVKNSADEGMTVRL
jgi:Na+-driven multidrug efflux pump